MGWEEVDERDCKRESVDGRIDEREGKRYTERMEKEKVDERE